MCVLAQMTRRAYPCSVLSEVAALVLNGVWVSQLPEESDFFDDILPLLKALLAHVGHLLDGHNLLREDIAGIIDCSKRAMSNLPQVFKYPVRIIMVKEVGNLRILQAPRSNVNMIRT